MTTDGVAPEGGAQGSVAGLRWLAEGADVPLPALDPAELRALGAHSPVLGLVEPVPADPAEHAAAVERLTSRGLLTGPDVEQPVTRPAGVVAEMLAVRAQPALVATVSVRPEGDGTPAAPTAAGWSGPTIAVLHGVALADGDLVGLLEETVESSGTHRFTLCTPSGQAERLFEAWVDLCQDGTPVGICCHVFVPDPEAPRHGELVLEADRDGVAQARSTWHADGWARQVPAGAGGQGWVDLFRAAMVDAGTAASGPA